MKKFSIWIVSVLVITSMLARAQGSNMQPTKSSSLHSGALHYGWEFVDGIHLFYREGGPVDAPTLFLLHGSPTSSAMYQTLMEELASTGQLHVIAMDYPSYGYSDAPDHIHYKYTFDNIAETVAHFLKARKITRYALFMQDYGVPIGFRLMHTAPENVSAIIVQNGVIHLDGFPAAEDPNGDLPRYWRGLNPSVDRGFANDVAHLSFPSASNWKLGPNMPPDEQLLMVTSEQRPGVVEARSDLWRDYGANTAHYAEWQKLLKTMDIPVEIIWGSKDTFFTVPGAIAYLNEAPKAEIHILNLGHFATLEAPDAIADLIAEFSRHHNLR